MTQIAAKTDDTKKIKDCLSKIENNSRHLVGIINDILDYSKMESGKLELDESTFSIASDMDFVTSMFTARAEEKRINLRMSLSGIENDGITTDSLRLNQVLINLISNAIKFTPQDGTIDVSVEEVIRVGDESVYCFAVTDTGIGIEPAQTGKLFTPFVQANATVNTNFGGTGLGLAISKNIIQKMGGEIEFDSCPGRGTTFSFTIRVKSQTSADIEEPQDGSPFQGETPDFSGKRILIVDDIEINREIAVELLRASGAEIQTACDGSDALKKFTDSAAGYFDIILMDIQMPVMDGCEAARNIRESGRIDARSIYIVAMTANVMQDDVKKTFDSGMNGHIAKPMVINEVFALMSKLLNAESCLAERETENAEKNT
jgi:CheY-like chemotaxis protein